MKTGREGPFCAKRGPQAVHHFFILQVDRPKGR